MQQYQIREHRFCANCGTPLMSVGNYCSYCGMPIHIDSQNADYYFPGYVQDQYQQEYDSGYLPIYGDYQQSYVQEVAAQTGGDQSCQENEEFMTRELFRREYAPDKFYRELSGTAFFMYIMIGILALYGWYVHIAYLCDAMIFLVLTLGMHLGRSKGCAVAIFVIGIITMLIGFLQNGQIISVFWIFSSASAWNTFSWADSVYDAQYGRNRN